MKVEKLKIIIMVNILQMLTVMMRMTKYVTKIIE